MHAGSKGDEGGGTRSAARSRGVTLNLVTPGPEAPRYYAFVQSRGSSATTLLERAAAGPVAGTVMAHIVAPPANDYGCRSETLIRGAPRDAFRELLLAEGSGPRLCAADIAAELSLINAQIRRIMSQVERAVARHATSG
jgi:hypothetical protein